MLDSDVRRVLGGTSIAHLATVLPDGSPHTVPLWVDTRGDQVVFLTGPDSRKARNLRRDPRTALSIATADNPSRQWSSVGGSSNGTRARRPGEIIDRISTKYTGAP